MADMRRVTRLLLLFSPLPLPLRPVKRYSLLKLNADVIRSIQVGITLSDCGTYHLTIETPRLRPPLPGSIALLDFSGINLTRNRQLGIPSTWIARHLLDAGLVGDFSKATWVAFHGCYDFAVLFKALFQLATKMRVRLPETTEEFMVLTKCFFGCRIYDVKCVMKSCDGLYRRLEQVAEKLDVQLAVGKAHQARSDSLLTCQVLLKMKKI